MKYIFVAVFVFSFFCSNAGIDPKKELEKLAESLIHLTEKQISIDDRIKYIDFKKELNILKSSYILLDNYVKKHTLEADYVSSLNLIGTAVFLLESNMEQYQAFAPRKWPEYRYENIVFNFRIYRTVYDAKLQQIDKKITRIRLHKSWLETYKNEEIKYLLKQKRDYLFSTIGLPNTFKDELAIVFNFKQEKVLDQEASKSWKLTDIKQTKGGGEVAGGIALSIAVSSYDSGLNEYQIALKRNRYNKGNVEALALNFPIRCAIKKLGKEPFSVAIDNFSALQSLNYKIKKKNYIYWTDAPEGLAVFQEKLSQKLKP